VYHLAGAEQLPADLAEVMFAEETRWIADPPRAMISTRGGFDMRIVMAGTGIFAEPTLQTLLAQGNVVGVFTQPDRGAIIERGSTRQTGAGIKNLAQAAGVPVFQPESINTPEGEAELRSVNPDLLVVAAYGQILKDFILNVPTKGCINVHASLLPAYRGAAPIARAIQAGETTTGVTIIRMSTGLDAGAMLAQESIAIGEMETSGDVEKRLSVLGAEMAWKIVQRIETGEPIAGIIQDKSKVTKAPKLTKEEGVIDWTQPAAMICNHIRAMHPWPTPFTFWLRAGQEPLRVIVHKARVRTNAAESTNALACGEIDPTRVDLLCVGAAARSVVEILELQPAGKKIMPAADFLRGRKPQPGDRLGSVTTV
jgi:methionyl-tRNA formyltransferase